MAFQWHEDIIILNGTEDSFVVGFSKDSSESWIEAISDLLGHYSNVVPALDKTVIVVKVIPQYSRDEVLRWLYDMKDVVLPRRKDDADWCSCDTDKKEPGPHHKANCVQHTPF